MLSIFDKAAGNKWIGNKQIRWFWLLTIPALWELCRHIGRVNPLIMPPFPDIFREFLHGLTSGELASRWVFSLALVFSGMLIATALALLLTLLSKTGKFFNSLLSAASALLHPLPGLALLPLIILVSGIGIPAVLLIIVHAVLWPMAANLKGGLDTQEPTWNLYARNLNLSRWKTFSQIAIPGTTPHLVAGLRIGWARAWRSLIAAEMVFGAVAYSGGLGWQLFEARVMMDAPSLYSGLIAVMITGIVVEDLVLIRLERRILGRWGLVDV